MADLRLAKLPERTPIKITIGISPALHQTLADYAALYSKTYGSDEPLAELIPAMLAAFLDSDRAFSRSRGGRK